MEAGTLVEWLKQPGDIVHRGDIVAVVETEKGAIEIEIFQDGRIDALLVPPGTKVPVGTALATLADEGVAPMEPPVPPAEPPRPAVATPPMAASPAPAATPGVRASPAARRLAEQRGIRIADTGGTGPGGAVVRADVARIAAQAPPTEAATAPQPRAGIDIARMRHAIAAGMARSKREIPHYYLGHSFDIGAAQQAVQDQNAGRLPADRLLLAALLIKAVALAMRDFPEFNGFHGPEGFQPSPAIHVGVAIALRGGGLAAPAIHHADRLSLADLMLGLRDLVGRVRRGGFRSSEIADPTVTVSSLGDRGVEMLLPVIYPPQVAIIGFGTPAPRPWILGDGVGVRPVMTMTLAADHRVSDGHRGAMLLNRIMQLLEEPRSL